MITAFVLIEAEPDAIAELAPALAEVEGVAESHSVAGSEAALVAILKVNDHQAIATTVTHGVAKLRGITGTRTLIAFQSYSSDELTAGYEGFGD